ncbi:alpha/beta hydrolase, partial [Burkholderia pseudomallei]
MQWARRARLAARARDGPHTRRRPAAPCVAAIARGPSATRHPRRGAG